MVIRTNVVAPTRPIKKEAPTKVVEKKVKKSVVKKPTEEVKKIFEEDEILVKEFSLDE